jgi:hypothetical protein
LYHGRYGTEVDIITARFSNDGTLIKDQSNTKAVKLDCTVPSDADTAALIDGYVAAIETARSEQLGKVADVFPFDPITKVKVEIADFVGR